MCTTIKIKEKYMPTNKKGMIKLIPRLVMICDDGSPPKRFDRHHTKCGFYVVSKLSKVMSVKDLPKSSFSP